MAGRNIRFELEMLSSVTTAIKEVLDSPWADTNSTIDSAARLADLPEDQMQELKDQISAGRLALAALEEKIFATTKAGPSTWDKISDIIGSIIWCKASSNQSPLTKQVVVPKFFLWTLMRRTCLMHHINLVKQLHIPACLLCARFFYILFGMGLMFISLICVSMTDENAHTARQATSRELARAGKSISSQHPSPRDPCEA